jgi:hypothetical protein
LVALLGVDSEMLHRPHPSHAQSSSWLPSISSWMDDSGKTAEDDVEPEDSDDEEICEAEELQNILDNEESSPISRSEKIDRRCLDLTSAALAMALEEATIVYVKISPLLTFMMSQSQSC